MFKKNLYIHSRIINYWFTFLLFLIVVSNLPHQPAPFFTWINLSLYFLLFLQCIYLIKQEQNNKPIYLNFSLFALFHCLDFVYLLMGNRELLGNDYMAFYFFEYITFLQDFSFAFCIIYIAIKYLFKELKNAAIYKISLSVIVPVFLWFYHPFLLDKAYMVNVEYIVYDKILLYFTFLPLFFLILYGIMLYKYDWSLGEHINTIMVCFFVMTVLSITNLVGNIYYVTEFVFTQYILLATLSMFLITMFKLLNHAYSPFGQFYDSIIARGKNMGVRIKRKKSTVVAVLEFAKAYFHQWRNAIGFGALILIFGINYSSIPNYVKLYIAVLSLGILLLFFYLTALYQKRSKKGDLLNVNQNFNT